MIPTKLFKIFNNLNCFLVICGLLILPACTTEKKDEDPSAFLKGIWRFCSIETNKSIALDVQSRKIYTEQMAEFITNSSLNLKDSTYTCTLGDVNESGFWKYDPRDSILSLKSSKNNIQMFRVFLRSKMLKLNLKNSKSKEYWELKQ